MPNSKRIYWISVLKLPIEKEEDRYVVKVLEKSVEVTNQLHRQMIDKYWNKATFIAVLPTTRNKTPLPQIVFIEFDF